MQERKRRKDCISKRLHLQTLDLSHSASLCTSQMFVAGSQWSQGLLKWNKQTAEIHFKEKASSAASSQSCQVENTISSSRRRRPVQDVSPPHTCFRLSSPSPPSQHLLRVGQKKKKSWYSLRCRMGKHREHGDRGWDQTWTKTLGKRYLQILGLGPNIWSFDYSYWEANGEGKSEGKG